MKYKVYPSELQITGKLSEVQHITRQWAKFIPDMTVKTLLPKGYSKQSPKHEYMTQNEWHV
jgi:hypothetical protein|uniref:Uncharacterized protein n=1 Tax=uncultured marine virus TaxID=186617 RepID=A0A0F7L3G0_9VIRU|nr:hypothetical protein [uncultured marine virus]